MYIDFHCHFVSEEILSSIINKCEYLCLSFYNAESFERFSKSKYFNNPKIKVVIGCHPWYLDKDFLQKILNHGFSKNDGDIKSRRLRNSHGAWAVCVFCVQVSA